MQTLRQIHPLSHEHPFYDPQAWEDLQMDYSRGLLPSPSVDPGVPCDIVDVLPLELWVRIVKEALPSDGYSSSLLLLTTVSYRWRDLILSTPTLWANIQIRSSEEDPLATIETFVYLSQNAPLVLYIYVPQSSKPQNLASLLARVGSRLREVRIEVDNPDDRRVPPSIQDAAILSMFYFILRNLGHIPSVTRIYLVHRSRRPIRDRSTALLMSNSSLPLSLREISGWSFHWRDLPTMRMRKHHLQEIHSSSAIEDVVTSHASFVDLKCLKITESNSLFTKGLGTSIRHEGFPPLPNLTHLSYNNGYRDVVIQLLESTAPQLLELELRIPFSKLYALRVGLDIAVRLRHLSITVDNWGDEDEEKDTLTGFDHSKGVVTSIPTLQRLSLCILETIRTPVDNKDHIMASSWLIDRFRSLYKGVKTLELDIAPEVGHAMMPLLLNYIGELDAITSLKLRDGITSKKTYWGHQIDVPTLEDLDTGNTQILSHLRAPNIHSLRVNWCTEYEILQMDAVQRLWIASSGQAKSTMKLDATTFPSLVELTISLDSGSPSFHGDLRLASFPFLSIITIHANMNSTCATQLCYTLLYSPATCPSLRDIRFPIYPPDWDILFLMLEKRNFLANRRISRIARITLPFVADELRPSLGTLLRGTFTRRPANDELLLGGGLELLLDETIIGCYTCLSNMLGGCKARVVKRDALGPIEKKFIPDMMCWSTPPESLDSSTVEWIERREFLLRSLLSSLAIWSYKRTSICDRRTWITPVQISEYDV